MVKVASSTCSSEATVIAGNRNRFAFRNAKLPANITWMNSSRIAGTQVTSDQEREQHRRLAGDVFGAQQRLREVDLQGVGAAIVGDQPGADVDGDDEDEEALLVEEVAEGLGASAQDLRRLRHVRRRTTSRWRGRGTASTTSAAGPRNTRLRIIVLMPAEAMTSQLRPSALPPP